MSCWTTDQPNYLGPGKTLYEDPIAFKGELISSGPLFMCRAFEFILRSEAEYIFIRMG